MKFKYITGKTVLVDLQLNMMLQCLSNIIFKIKCILKSNRKIFY